MIRPVAIPRLCSICALASWLAVGLVSSPAAAQNPAHPDAKPPLPENPYLSYREPYRWDIRAQLFLQAGNVVAYYPGGHRDGIFDDVISTEWQVKDIELVYPVVREGAFYWSPNEDVQVDIRLDEADVFDLYGA